MKNIWIRGWQTSKPLMLTGQLMLFNLAVCLGGLALDPTLITGQPAWLKPAKFAISVALFSFTLTWILSFVDRSPRLTRAMAWIVSAVFVVEIVIIDVQAARGTTSHFNTATVLDRTLFSTMGVGIAMLWVCSMILTGVLFRQYFADRSWGWALRLGMLISVLGMGLGGFMTVPTRQQIREANLTRKMPVSGAHTIGAPDGGPGLPGTGWSTEHGDMRPAHFLGMHAMQTLPLIAWFTRRRRSMGTVQLAAASHFSLFAILVWQALRGQSIVQPDSATVLALGIWAVGTLVGMFAVTHRRPEMTLATGHHS